MELLEYIKTVLRVKTPALDEEIQTLIEAALFDIQRVGVNPSVANPMVKQAVAAYCKAHFGYDNAEAARFDESYRRIVCDLMNSPDNSSTLRGRRSL